MSLIVRGAINCDECPAQSETIDLNITSGRYGSVELAGKEMPIGWLRRDKLWSGRHYYCPKCAEKVKP